MTIIILQRCPEQKARDREILSKAHQPIDPGLRKHPAPDCDIAKTDHKKDRQNDIEKGLHLGPEQPVRANSGAGGAYGAAKLRRNPSYAGWT